VLDAYIIEEIKKREEERRRREEAARPRLRIEVPERPMPPRPDAERDPDGERDPDEEEDEDEKERGIVRIDL
jgi:hypothetical protein